ncbi:hypothetical protein ANME2D_02318 [Candidatus Methanoperedens nitroreducens]|uniref:Uncharacterized protein n=1 Tax=Candidatus Methanoperedens nitratireducens TaxID=1392998 RepID=A0A062V4Q5_9EURY|nr:hypothetical protein [Candidatus Methanoperedens nitroreducens]KCZ71583.1 hypothetical protein ANME2D_02318 [Candidatus Methanoperedens nitroreducens]MDJ1421212.1 hypothetical protein [Candidatus Methanoperedens sp.]
MLKYLKGQDLKILFAGKEISLPCPRVADFDLLNAVLRGYGSASLEAVQLKNNAVMALADRLIERAKLPIEIKEAIDANAVVFYFQFGVELDLYLVALFPQTEAEEGDSPLVSKNQSDNS